MCLGLFVWAVPSRIKAALVGRKNKKHLFGGTPCLKAASVVHGGCGATSSSAAGPPDRHSRPPDRHGNAVNGSNSATVPASSGFPCQSDALRVSC